MDKMPHIVGVHSVFPSEFADQARITEALKMKWQDEKLRPGLLERFHQSAQVKRRHISMPIENYFSSKTFAERNQIYIEVGVELAQQAVEGVLEKAGVLPADISQIIFTTVTGIAVPTIDARLMNRLPFKASTKRVPLFGLGCVAGAAGISRAADYLKGHPNERVLLIALELCSLTFQDDDVSMANLVSSGLFGDGCAAVVLAGGNIAREPTDGPKVVDSCSFFFEDTERVMGFDINDHGFKIVLSGDVPSIARERIPPCIDQLLARHHLHRSDIAAWVAHPGGPKVMDALTESLKLPPHALRLSYECLAEVGNLSSASVLVVLEKTLASREFRSGDYGVLLAMGPAFCAEVVVLKW